MPIKKPTQIPVVLVGLGRIGVSLEDDPKRQKPCTHAGTVRALPKLYSILAGVDIDSKVRKQFAQRHPGRPVYASLTEYAAGRPTIAGKPIRPKSGGNTRQSATAGKPTRPLFVIAADSEMHATLLGRILKLNPAGVLIEKPVCLSVAEYNRLKRIAGTARKKGVPIWVNHERRFHPAYMYVASKLAAARMADDPKHPDHLLEIHSWLSCGGRFDGPFEENSPLYHDGTHILDAANFLMGVPVTGRRRMEVLAAVFRRQRAGLTLGYGEAFHNVTLRSGADYFAFEMQVRTRSALYIIGNGYFYEHFSKESPYYTGFRSLQPEQPEKTAKRLYKFKRDLRITDSPFINLYTALHRALTMQGGQKKKTVPNDSPPNLDTGLEVIRQIHTGYSIGERE